MEIVRKKINYAQCSLTTKKRMRRKKTRGEEIIEAVNTLINWTESHLNKDEKNRKEANRKEGKA